MGTKIEQAVKSDKRLTLPNEFSPQVDGRQSKDLSSIPYNKSLPHAEGSLKSLEIIMIIATAT